MWLWLRIIYYYLFFIWLTRVMESNGSSWNCTQVVAPPKRMLNIKKGFLFILSIPNIQIYLILFYSFQGLLAWSAALTVHILPSYGLTLMWSPWSCMFKTLTTDPACPTRSLRHPQLHGWLSKHKLKETKQRRSKEKHTPRLKPPMNL